MSARDPLAIVREYHEQTKHHFNRFARSLGYLDWATQPDPFRTFEGSRRIDLIDVLRAAEKRDGPRHASWRAPAYDALFDPVPPSAPVAPGLAAVAIFLRFSLGLSAWKQAGPSRWALRVTPSSGNLHPTEGYVLCGPGVAGAEPGIYHYAPDAHALEERSRLDPAVWSAACAGLPGGSFLAALTSIHWREAWKYGERAFRYFYLHTIRNSSHTFRHTQGCGKSCIRVKNDITLFGILFKKTFDQAFCITNIIILKDGWQGVVMLT